MQRLFFLFISAAVLGGGCARSSLAQTPLADTTLALPDVTVTATRHRIALAEAPVRMTVLDTHAIQATAAATVADLLDARSSAFLRRYGAGGNASLSFRGTGPSQTLVLLNGHRIGDPQLGQIDFTLLPTAVLESVELRHGAGSALYGSDGLGGVVNLHTLRPADERLVRVHGTLGAFEDRRLGGAASARWGPTTGLVAADYETAQNDFPYVNTALFPPQTVRRTGADRTQVSLFGTLQHERERHRTDLGGWLVDTERGLPGPGTQAPIGERQWDRQLRFWTHHETRRAWGTVRLGGLVQRSLLRYRNPTLELDDTGRTWIGSLDAEARLALGNRHYLAGGVTGGFGQATHPQLRTGAAERHVGAFLNGTGAYGRLLVYPALRLDTYLVHAASAQTALSPNLGLNLRLLNRWPLWLKAAVGRAFRVPTFNQRFWVGVGNPTLRPEHGWTFDVGGFVQTAGQQIELNLYAARITDQLAWLPIDGAWRPENVQRVHSRGLELAYRIETRAPAFFPVNAGLIYSWSDARDRSDPASGSFDQQLRYVPRHQVKTFGGLGWRGTALDVSARVVGSRHVTTDGRQRLDPYAVLDAHLRYTHRFDHATATLGLALENLLDAPYTVLKDYPMPPRHARLRLELTL